LGLLAAATLEPVGDLAEFQWAQVRDVAAGSDQSDAAKKDLPENFAEEASDSEQIARWAANRPDVRAAQAEVEAARARLELACASRVPNVKAGPVYERDEGGTTFLGVEAQIALPILNTGNPMVRQRQAELHQRQASLEQLQLKAQLEIHVAVERYERARRVTEQYSADFTDGMTRDVRRIEDQFEAGQTDQLHVYSARTSMIQTRLTYLDSFHELARAAAAITAATGLGHDVLLTVPQDRQP
jgi:outer membrane protein TolC